MLPDVTPIDSGGGPDVFRRSDNHLQDNLVSCAIPKTVGVVNHNIKLVECLSK